MHVCAFKHFITDMKLFFFSHSNYKRRTPPLCTCALGPLWFWLFKNWNKYFGNWGLETLYVYVLKNWHSISFSCCRPTAALHSLSLSKFKKIFCSFLLCSASCACGHFFHWYSSSSRTRAAFYKKPPTLLFAILSQLTPEQSEHTTHSWQLTGQMFTVILSSLSWQPIRPKSLGV